MRTLTKEKRDALTPIQAIALLKEGNKRFMNNLKVNRNLLQQVNETSAGQYPFAFILSCIDSRTSAELIFDQGLGDIFSCRVAGNVLNEDILGSMEFACKIAGSKVIVVLGHTKCGAVKGACDGVELGHLTGLLEKIKSVIRQEQGQVDHISSADPLFVEHVARLNIKHVLKEIPERSPVIAELLEHGKIVIIGGLYEVETGSVYLDETEMIASPEIKMELAEISGNRKGPDNG
jgi:carbonic anhydrase